MESALDQIESTLDMINDETNNSEIIVYSLNGKQISNLQLYYQLTNPIIINDLNANEYLSYIGKEAISIVSLPHLELMANIDIKSNIDINNMFMSQDKLSLYCTNESGNKIYVIRDEVKKIGGNGVCGRELCCSSFLNGIDGIM